VKAVAVDQRDRTRRWDTYFMYSYRHGSMQAKPDGTVYALPFHGDTPRRVGQGYHGSFSHHGEHAYSLDFMMPIGTPVTAARDGVVVHVVDRFDGYGTREEYKERNNFVLVEHADGTIGNYVHFRKGGVRVRPGQKVAVGDVLGEVGLTGFTTPHPHIHFSVFVAVDAKRIRTFPVRFRTADGDSVAVVEGRSYRAR
jgi:murein DD-endopeptidase MepM/ murein hydrolase activator NlpD